jgi:hypothetical protein
MGARQHREFRRRSGSRDDLRAIRRRRQSRHADGHAFGERAVPYALRFRADRCCAWRKRRTPGKLAAAVLEELSISKADVASCRMFRWTVCWAPPGRPAQAVAAALRAAGLPPHGSRARLEPCVDGKIIPAQTFDPRAPEISADVPLIVGTVLNEFINGIDHPDAFSMTEEQLAARVDERYAGKARRSSKSSGRAIRRRGPSSCTRSSWPPRCAAMP